jgi:hypothetical protein
VVADVIPVEGDVQVADPGDPEAGPKAPRKRDASIRNAQHQKVFRMQVAGLNGGCKPFYGGVNLPGADRLGRSHCAKYCMEGEPR